MNRTDPQCNRKQLAQAISETLDDSTEAKLAEHLSNCELCREQLAELAGEEAFWNRATSNLAASASFKGETKTDFHSSVFVKVDHGVIGAASISHDEHFTQDADAPFDPPSHPEMLGRVDGFSIEQIIGRGGMGVVYKGFDAELNRPVAIKFLAPHLSVSGVARKRFAREAQAAAAVVHPNVVPIYSIGTSQKRPYIVMALVSGRSLQKHVEEHGPLPADDVVRIAQQIAAGLSAAHEQGLVHRDIKPANILLEKEVSRVLITDFGLARAADDAGLTQSGWLAGTPHYMSPEQTMGDDVDHRSDLFSLGSVMYFMATGREPFRAENPYAVLQKIVSKDPTSACSVNSQVPATLDNFIFTLLEKDPANRIDSATSVQEVLTQYLAHLQNPTQHPQPKVKRRMKSTWRSRAVAVFVIATIALFALQPFAKSFFAKSFFAKSSFENATRQKANVPVTKLETPTTQSESAATPTWISELTSARQWDTEMAAIQKSIDRLDQPLTGTANSIDKFELEKSALRDQIQAMENSFGIQNN